MADQFIGEIRIMGCTFAPVGWAQCNGQIIPINQNTALFSLLGTFYGGDGRSNFALPNLQGSAPMDYGNGTGLTPRDLGESSGEQAVTLLTSQLPAHTHTQGAIVGPGNTPIPDGAIFAASFTYQYAAKPNTTMAQIPVGGSQPHNNLPPYLVMNFVIALQGIFPARS
jgi:microcystin-dependent protein